MGVAAIFRGETKSSSAIVDIRVGEQGKLGELGRPPERFASAKTPRLRRRVQTRKTGAGAWV